MKPCVRQVSLGFVVRWLALSLWLCGCGPGARTDSEGSPRRDSGTSPSHSAASSRSRGQSTSIGGALPPALRAAFVRSTQESAPARFAWKRDASGLSASGGQARFTLRRGALEMEPPEGSGWKVSLATTEFGREGATGVLAPGSVLPEQRSNAARSARTGLVERWVHGPLGVEHLYEIPRRPAGEGPLAIELAVTGLLVVPESEGEVLLLDRSGVARARYGALFVHDADGRALSARFAVHGDGSGMLLLVEDDGARYPVVIDPLLATEEATLSMSGDAVENGFGYAVSLSADESRAIVGAPNDDTAMGADAGSARVFTRNGSSWSEEASLMASDASAGDFFGYSVSLSSDGSRALVGAYADDTVGGGNAGSATVFVRSGGSWTEEEALFASGAAPEDFFGHSVSLSSDGSRALVGAYADDTAGAANAGSACVFVRSGGSWTEEATLLASAAAAGDNFGYAAALSPDGTRALLGAHGDDTGAGVDAGSARVFVRSGTSWTEETTLLASGAAAGDGFGSSVSLSSDGSRALVGAPLDDTVAGADAGSARAFVRGGTAWSEEATLLATSPTPGDQFGLMATLSSDGSRALVGAPFDDTAAGANSGSASVFVRSGSTWSAEATLLAPGAAANDNFAFAISLSSDGSRALVGVRLDDTAVGPDAGSASVFVRSGGTWSAEATVVAPGSAANDGFGSAVSLSSDGSRAIVGSPGDGTEAGLGTGSARVFVRNGGGWSEEATLLAPGAAASDRFGASVALSSDGSWALVGANGDDTGVGLDAGSAWVFVRSGSAWTEGATLLASGAAAADGFGNSVSLSSDGSRALVGASGDDTAAGQDAGSVRVFVRSGSAWTEEATLFAPGAAASDAFGTSVALSGDGTRVLSGASSDDTAGGQNAGSASVFVRSGSIWTAEATLLASGAAANDNLGFAVSVSSDGSRVLVGAPLDNTPSGFDVGSARVFVRAGSAWSEEAVLLAADAAANDQLGFSVSLSSDGRRALVGAHSDDTVAGANAGSARVFVRSGSGWSEQAVLLPTGGAANDAFGRAVSLSSDGSRVLVGAYADDTVAVDSGSARTFTLGLTDGSECLAGVDCVSGFCVDGVCCNSACGGGPSDCQACSVAAGGTTDGTCGALTPAAAPAVVCRASAGVCDVPEVCSSSSTACPTDALLMAGTECRPAAGACDVVEACTGASAGCPADALLTAGTTCRVSAGACDIAESCTGAAPTCPADTLVAVGTECSPASCDGDTEVLASACTGGAATCPPPVVNPCAPFTCVALACAGSCTNDGECASGAFCTVGQDCEPQHGPGQPCSRPGECTSGACTSGTCAAPVAVPAVGSVGALGLGVLLLLFGAGAHTRRRVRDTWP